jgi:hypothetical protein
MYGLKELLQDRNSGRSQAAGTLEAQFAGELLEVPAQDGHGIAEAGKARIAADLADGAQNAHGPELLEDVGVAEDGRLEGLRLVAGLVLKDGRDYCGYLLLREAHLAEKARGMGTGVSDMVPAREIFRIRRAMTDEDAQIVQPGSGNHNVAVMREIGAEDPGQLDQAGLMAKLIHRAGLGFNVEGQLLKGSSHETFVIFHEPDCSSRIPEEPAELKPLRGFVDRVCDISPESRECCLPLFGPAGGDSIFQHPKLAKLLYRA